jgi:hypothetical protein
MESADQAASKPQPNNSRIVLEIRMKNRIHRDKNVAQLAAGFACLPLNCGIESAATMAMHTILDRDKDSAAEQEGNGELRLRALGARAGPS